MLGIGINVRRAALGVRSVAQHSFAFDFLQAILGAREPGRACKQEKNLKTENCPAPQAPCVFHRQREHSTSAANSSFILKNFCALNASPLHKTQVPCDKN